MSQKSSTSNCWFSSTVFTTLGTLVYFGCEARAQELKAKGFFRLTQADMESAFWIVIGAHVGLAGLVLGGGLLAAAIILSLSGKSKGANAVTALGKFSMIGSVVAFIIYYSQKSPSAANKIIDFNIIQYTYVAGVVLLFIGLIAGPSTIASQTPGQR